MHTRHNRYEDFLLTDDEYVARMVIKLAHEAAVPPRHDNYAAGGSDDTTGEYGGADDYCDGAEEICGGWSPVAG
jgi:hypothetical protein